MDDRCYSSFKSDLDRLIIVNDEIKTTGQEQMYKSQSGISRSQNQPNQPNLQSQLEGSNRDMKRKSVANKFIWSLHKVHITSFSFLDKKVLNGPYLK